MREICFPSIPYPFAFRVHGSGNQIWHVVLFFVKLDCGNGYRFLIQHQSTFSVKQVQSNRSGIQPKPKFQSDIISMSYQCEFYTIRCLRLQQSFTDQINDGPPTKTILSIQIFGQRPRMCARFSKSEFCASLTCNVTTSNIEFCQRFWFSTTFVNFFPSAVEHVFVLVLRKAIVWHTINCFCGWSRFCMPREF